MFLTFLKFMFYICILPLAIIFITIFLVKFIYDYAKYGNKIFSAFKKHDISSARDELLLLSLQKIQWYKKIVKVEKLSSNYVVVDDNGISIFKVFTEVGLFKGNDNSKYLYYKTNGHEARIKNPLLGLDKDENELLKLFPNTKITKYLVITESTLISCNTDSKLIQFNNLPLGLPKPVGEDTKTIDKIEKKINDTFNNAK